MYKHLEYALLGKGRWAQVMHRILAQHSRATIVEQTRRGADENEGDYQQRMSAALASTGAHAAWICMPPSSNTLLLIAAAITRGMHVVVEKPWVWDRSIAQELASNAEARGVLIGVHYEYCLLDEVETWRTQLNSGADLQFRGRFTTSGPDRLGIPDILNLGSHLFAIRNYAVPKAQIAAIDCGYDRTDERAVSLAREGNSIARIDFSANREPIIQRFIERFEGALRDGLFPFNLDFASQVQDTHKAFHREETGP